MARNLVTMVSVLCVSITAGLLRAETLQDSLRDQAWNDAWPYCSAITVMEDFEWLYLPHAEALLRASETYGHGGTPQDVAAGLNALPGVRGTVLVSKSGDELRLPADVVSDEVIPDRFHKLLERPLAWRSPMLKRLQGGQIRYETIEDGERALHFMARYLLRDTLSPPDAATFLALDPAWFRAPLVSRMDSLARESRQLLFWATSPTNFLKEQSLGITWGNDTLWWAGPKNVTIACVQPLWPFGGEAEVHSFIRSLGRKP